MQVSAIIPAYNEEKTISSVIDILKKIDYIDEVVVINDGSTDKTGMIAEASGARVISLRNNQGKGAALQKGIEEIDTDILLMLDADLLGLQETHIKQLIDPLFNELADMTVGVFNNGRSLTDLAQFITPNLSGQRAVRRSILNDIKNLNNVGYGVEIALNKYVKKHGKIVFVNLPNLTHVMKEEKRGLAKGVLSRVKMYWDILKVILTA